MTLLTPHDSFIHIFFHAVSTNKTLTVSPFVLQTPVKTHGRLAVCAQDESIPVHTVLPPCFQLIITTTAHGKSSELAADDFWGSLPTLAEEDPPAQSGVVNGAEETPTPAAAETNGDAAQPQENGDGAGKIYRLSESFGGQLLSTDVTIKDEKDSK